MNAISPLPPFAALRLRLFEMGYKPVPIYPHDAGIPSAGKRPIGTSWQNRAALATPDQIRRWEPGNTGVLCGRLIGLDLDILDPALSEQVDALAEQMLGATPLHRIGRAPKRLRCYRAAVPMAKVETPELFLADRTKVQVEALGEGQQFVAYGIHPETLQEYSWPESGPDVIPLDDLPEVQPGALKAFVAAAEVMLRAAGGLTKSEREGKSTPPLAVPKRERVASGPRARHSVDTIAEALD